MEPAFRRLSFKDIACDLAPFPARADRAVACRTPEAVCAFSLPDIVSSIVTRSRTSAVFASSSDTITGAVQPYSTSDAAILAI
jgi:hypothetical protein